MSADGRHAIAAPASAEMKKSDIGFVSGKINPPRKIPGRVVNRPYRCYKTYKTYSRRSLGDFGLRPLRFGGELQFATRRVRINERRLAVAYFAFQDAASDRRFELWLYRAFERTRAVERVISHAHQMRARRVGLLLADVAFGQAPPQPVDLDFNDLF